MAGYEPMGGFTLGAAGGTSQGRKWTRAKPKRGSKSDTSSDEAGSGGLQARLANMYRPPIELMTELPLKACLGKAALEGRWVLAIALNRSEFGCMSFVRDALKHPDVLSVIEQGYALWCQPNASGEGVMFERQYGVNGSTVAWPLQCILDPRTGEMRERRMGPMTGPDEFDWLAQFIANHSLTGIPLPKPHHHLLLQRQWQYLAR